MRATELLGLPVYDRDGVALGPLRDLRVAWQDAPAPGPAVASRFEIAGIVVGSGRLAGIAHAWGFAEGRASGPWPLRRLFSQAVGRARFAPASEVRSWGPDAIELGCRAAELRPLMERTGA